MQPSILIADDHSIIRKGLKLYIQFDLGCTDVREVSTCSDLMKELVWKKFTHLVLDIILTDGSTLEIIPNIRRTFPDLNILVFSMQPEEIYGEALKQYGIKHYLSKTSEEIQILKKLRGFLENANEVKTKPGITGQVNPFSHLTPRELEVLHYILKGVGTKETSEILNLKMNTVSTLKNRIFEKTKAVNVKQLLDMASLYNVNY